MNPELKKLLRKAQMEENPYQAILDALEEQKTVQMSGASMIKGEKGDQGIQGVPGYTPQLGKDYFTPEQVAAFLKESTPVKGKHYFTPNEIATIAQGIKDLATPKKGVDYFDGEDGAKPIAGIDYPIPRDGRDGSPDQPQEIADKLNTLKNALKPSVIDGLTESIVKELKDPKGKNRLSAGDILNMPARGLLDMRWHGGGGDGDHKVKVDDADTTPDFLAAKLVAGSNITLTINNVGGDETITIASTGGSYVPPEITLSSSPAAGTVREPGDDLASIDLFATTVKHTDPITQVIFYRESSPIFTVPSPNPNGGVETYTDTTPVTTTTGWEATVSDGTTLVQSNTDFIYFAFAYYYGVGAPGLDISSDGGGLTKTVILDTDSVSEIFNPVAQVYYFAYPDSYAALTSIKDTNGFETISDWNVTTGISVTNSFGQTTTYRLYEFDHLTTQTNFTNTFIQ